MLSPGTATELHLRITFSMIFWGLVIILWQKNNMFPFIWNFGQKQKPEGPLLEILAPLLCLLNF
jgi:hypothetical protein